MKIKEADRDDLPRNWFEQWADLAAEKPFVIAETAYPAENLKMTPVWGFHVNIEAIAAWQANYVAIMLAELIDLDATFVAWFVPRDYDEMKSNSTLRKIHARSTMRCKTRLCVFSFTKGV